MTQRIATIDFHLTCECSQQCPYCWGPQECEKPVDTETAGRIIERIKDFGARRVVFTGGDPLTRADAPELLRHARDVGLEVALSTTGDRLTRELLALIAPYLDLVSLPVDGATEEVSARTKKAGHLAAVKRALEWLRDYPEIDVKLCTPVTRHNLAAIPGIARTAEAYARTTRARVFYNVFQAFPRAMFPVDWDGLLVRDEEFKALERSLPRSGLVRVTFLDHETLDRLYVMVFPDGSLIVPHARHYLDLGPFLGIGSTDELDTLLDAARFDWAKHLRHSEGWRRPQPRPVRPVLHKAS